MQNQQGQNQGQNMQAQQQGQVQQMQDKDMMQDVLLTAKTLSTMYHFAAQESSTEQVHSEFKKCMSESVCGMHDIFKAMEQQGWYPQQQAQQQQISQLITKMQSGQQSQGQQNNQNPSQMN